jgi:hypothetical protein
MFSKKSLVVSSLSNGNVYCSFRLRIPNRQISSCWNRCVVWGAHVMIRTRASLNKFKMSSPTWLGQLSISKTAFHSANSSRVRNSLRFGRKTVRIYSTKHSALTYGFWRDFGIKSVPNRTPCFLILVGHVVSLERSQCMGSNSLPRLKQMQ